MTTVSINARRRSTHNAATRITDADIVRSLVDRLGATLVAMLTDRDRSSVSRWQSGQGNLSAAASRRARVAYEIFSLLDSYEDQHTVRAWFIGINPQLEDVSPVEAIAADKFREVHAAANAFITGG